jgi:perosamine synthetase
MTQLQAATSIPFARTVVTNEAVDAVSQVLRSGWLTTGPQVVDFERELGELVAAPHAVAVSSCTAALELSLRALRLPAGAKVLTPSLTFCGAVNAIVHAGYTPAFVDLDAATLTPSAETVKAATARVKGADAMVVLHYAGYPAPVAELAEAADLPLSRVIEDAAHAVGTLTPDGPVGSTSAATCFSFYATKNLPIGEGGMVTTADEEIADFVRRARLHGMSRDAWKRYLPGASWRYQVDVGGLKANMTDIQAAIGRAHLRAFPAWQARRAELVARYDAMLSGVKGVMRPARPGRGEGTHAWHLYVVRIMPDSRRDRDAVIAGMTEQRVGTSVHFIPNHQQPHFQRLLGPDPATHCPEADRVAEQILSLPLHPWLEEAEVDRVCDVLAELTTAKHSIPKQREESDV